jgi:hypothetical protein
VFSAECPQHPQATRLLPSAACRLPPAYCYDAFVKASRVAGLIILILIIAGVAYAYFPPFRLITWVAAGRSPVCSLREALKSQSNFERQVAYKDQILNASKLLG